MESLSQAKQSLTSWFWSESIWCPKGLTWNDLKPEYAQFYDLYYSIITACFLIILRFTLEQYLFRPLALISGLKFPIQNPLPNNYTEINGDDIANDKNNNSNNSKNHKKNNQNNKNNNSVINGNNIVDSNMTEHQIKRYHRITAFNVKKQSTIDKFTEGAWRFTFYTASTIFGWFFVLRGKPYISNTMHCFYDYPHHPVTTEEWWYYNIELGFYLSLLCSQFFDTKRKDFWQMFMHHIVTVLLITLSWACNFHRMGSLVLAIHDVADIPLELAKLFKYAKFQRCADLVFVFFTFTWILTRCYVLPTRVIYYTAYEATKLIPVFPAYYIFNALLCFLQLLHFIWTWLIIKMMYYAIKNDGVSNIAYLTLSFYV